MVPVIVRDEDFQRLIRYRLDKLPEVSNTDTSIDQQGLFRAFHQIHGNSAEFTDFINTVTNLFIRIRSDQAKHLQITAHPHASRKQNDSG